MAARETQKPALNVSSIWVRTEDLKAVIDAIGEDLITKIKYISEDHVMLILENNAHIHVIKLDGIVRIDASIDVALALIDDLIARFGWDNVRWLLRGRTPEEKLSIIDKEIEKARRELAEREEDLRTLQEALRKIIEAGVRTPEDMTLRAMYEGALRTTEERIRELQDAIRELKEEKEFIRRLRKIRRRIPR